MDTTLVEDVRVRTTTEFYTRCIVRNLMFDHAAQSSEGGMNPDVITERKDLYKQGIITLKGQFETGEIAETNGVGPRQLDGMLQATDMSSEWTPAIMMGQLKIYVGIRKPHIQDDLAEYVRQH